MISAARAALAHMQLAIMLLTRLPAGNLPQPAPTLAKARWAFPFVGLIIGLIAWAVQHSALNLGFAPMAASFLAVAAIAAATGALHFDGLADFADGMGGGRDREHCLEIMRDSRIGTYGVLALVLFVSLYGTALASFEAGAPLTVFLFAAVGSRLAMIIMLDRMPAARGDGLGHLARGSAFLAWLPGAVCVGGLGVWLGPVAGFALLAGLVGAGLVARIAQARIGGQTGDVLGAGQAISDVMILLALSAALPNL
ncbi:MAG: adenosylcobinamide-GDP ribazoletransferase [Roseinatronobacter sp.]